MFKANIQRGINNITIDGITLDVTKLIELVGKPLLVPSANISGEPPALNSDEVKKIFGNNIEYIVEGSAKIGQATTVADFTGDKIIILREGPITLQEIESVIKGE